jgi:hypothetical protein
MTLADFEEFTAYTKAYAEYLKSNTTLIEDYERTLRQHQLLEEKRIRDFEEEARDDYYSSLADEETHDDDE